MGRIGRPRRVGGLCNLAGHGYRDALPPLPVLEITNNLPGVRQSVLSVEQVEDRHYIDDRPVGRCAGDEEWENTRMLINSTYDKLVAFLGASSARYRIIEHAAEGRTDIASALRGNSLAQAAKSIVVRITLTKKRGKYLLAVIPGDKYVDLIKLSQLAGGTKAAFAARDVAERLTASVSGSIAPFSFNCELLLIVDKGLLVHEEIFFNAARLDRSVALGMEDYLSLTCPWVENIATEVADRIESRCY